MTLPIDMVSDVVCPWCFIGKRRLEKAIALKPEIAVEVRFREPRIPVLSNVTAQPFPGAAAVPEMLARQLVQPVRWQDTLAALQAAGKGELFELGPGAQLKAMVKRMDAGAWKAMKNVSV